MVFDLFTVAKGPLPHASFIASNSREAQTQDQDPVLNMFLKQRKGDRR